MENFQTPKQGPVSSNMRFGVLAAAALLLVVAVFFAFYYFKSTDKQAETVTTLESGEVMTTASEGELVTGFPKELLIGSDEVEGSYSIQYASEGVELPVANFKSKLSVEETVAKYGEYLKNNGWTIVHEANPAMELTFWYAQKDLQDVNVTIQKRDDGVYVTVALTNRTPAAPEENL